MQSCGIKVNLNGYYLIDDSIDENENFKPIKQRTIQKMETRAKIKT